MIRITDNQIFMYGAIGWEIYATEVANALNDLSARYQTIILRLHTPGGSITEGNLIYNAIKQCKATVVVQIDGLCASMGSIIMLAAARVEAAENSMLMIHVPSGYTHGTVKDHQASIKLLQGFEKSFKTALTAKTGGDDATVSSWLDGGDHWFTAAEAKELGLIDGITDAVADFQASAKPTDRTTQTALYQSFAAALILPIPDKKPNTNETEQSMKQVLETLGLAATATENDAVAAITAMQTHNAAVRKAQITDAVAHAVSKNLIAEAKTAHFIALGEKVGVDELKNTFDAMAPAIKPIDLVRKPASGNGTAIVNKKFTELTQDELLDMRENNREQYVALYESEYGFKPQF